MSRRRQHPVQALLAVLLLLAVAACGGGDEPEPRESATPSESPSPAESPVPAESPASPAPESPAPAAPAPPRAAPAPRPAPPPAPPPPGAPQPLTGPAAPGQYVFDETGSISTGGCLVANQAPPTPTRLNVGPVNGNRQSIDRDQTGSGGSAGSLSNAVFEYRPDGMYLVSLRQEQRVNAQRLVFEFQANPPARIIPGFPVVGDTGGFALTSTDGQVRINANTTVEAVGEQVRLAEGAVVPTVRLRTQTTISGVSPQGSLNLTLNRTSWYATDKHLEVKDVTDTTGTVGLCRVNFHVESLARAA